MRLFEGQTVIITGAARGLGRDYAAMFAQDGANVVLADLAGAPKTATDLADRGADVLDHPTDVTSRASTDALMQAASDRFGGIDILVNNAGLWRGLAEQSLLDHPEGMWNAAFAVNVTGSLHCFQSVVPFMRDRGRGRIVNVSSMASIKGGDAYGLTKALVEHMTQGMAREVGRFGITVNCLAPGACAFGNAKGEIPALLAIIDRTPMGRLGTTRDLYAALRYLCDAGADWVTGQTLRVDGGAILP